MSGEQKQNQSATQNPPASRPTLADRIGGAIASAFVGFFYGWREMVHSRHKKTNPFEEFITAIALFPMGIVTGIFSFFYGGYKGAEVGGMEGVRATMAGIRRGISGEEADSTVSSRAEVSADKKGIELASTATTLRHLQPELDTYLQLVSNGADTRTKAEFLANVSQQPGGIEKLKGIYSSLSAEEKPRFMQAVPEAVREELDQPQPPAPQTPQADIRPPVPAPTATAGSAEEDEEEEEEADEGPDL